MPAYLDRLVFRFVREDPADLLGPLERNEVDAGLTLGGAFFNADAARQVRKLPGWRVASWPGPAMEHFVFRVGPGGHPALRLKLVRQALAFGIDRVAIAREIQREAPAASRSPLDSTVFLPTEASYRPNWSRYRYDVARAQRLLGQAGCRRGADGIYACVGERLRLRVVTSAGAAVRQRVVELAAAQLRRVGVEVVPVYAPQPVFLGQILPRGTSTSRSSPGSVMAASSCGQGDLRERARTSAGTAAASSHATRSRTSSALWRSEHVSCTPWTPSSRRRCRSCLVVQPVIRAFHRRSLQGIVHGGGPFEFTQDAENWWLDR